jgi:5-methylcytosine-specific restriction protein A
LQKITSSSAETLRKLICKAQRDKKEDPSSRGGNSTKKILISANLSDKQWKSNLKSLNNITSNARR